MTKQLTYLRAATIWTVAVICFLASPLCLAQDWEPPGSGFGGLDDGPEVSLIAYFKVKPDSNLGKIYVAADIKENWHLYSVTQPKNGPIRSVMVMPETDDYKLIGPWEPDEPPHVEFNKDFGVDVEDHEISVIWSAPIEFATEIDTKEYEIEFQFTGQTCITGGSCKQIDEDLTATFDGEETSEIVRGELIAETEEDEPEREVIADTPEEIAAMAALYDADQKINYVKLDGSSGQGTFLAALFGAFVGGMLLNLMPCVFPVLGLKVLGFVEQAGSDPFKIKMHGVAFAGGLVFSMWVLAGAILAIKASSGDEVNWGQQMGNPYFVGGIVLMLFVLGLNLAGVFEMGLFMTKVGGSGASKGYYGSFVGGIVTTLVATPCSGPFLGTAMGYTLAQTAPIAMFLFTIFGLGIAFPYLIMSFFPSLINLLPKPGAWMETFKKLMAFTLFAAAAFFVATFGKLTGVDGLSWFLMALCVIALAAFFYGKWSPAYVKGPKRQVWGWLVPILIAGSGCWMTFQAAQMEAPLTAQQGDWELWVPGKVENKLANNKPIWVDYTANW